MRPEVVENARDVAPDMDAFVETCTTYSLAVSTWFHANDSDEASEPVTRRLLGAGHRYVGVGAGLAAGGAADSR
ncbi:hypothetical protein GCM10009821_07200 [Aeromicrobium halocynthiae]|uniref:Uncharacterized protein n=1 Tax=Aeromicrobium halocynthiae TaxID=560557 RepID=A0ABN2VT60_9ACTN